MKITFIRPHLYDSRSADAMEPLVFAVLAGLTPPGIELELFDERLESIPIQIDTDLVAMTVETYTARRAYRLADQYRAQGIPVVLGGYHATFLPDEAGAHADAVVLGDAESVWVQLLADLQLNQLQPRYQGVQLPLAKIPFDRSIFAGKRYQPLTPVQFGRGCRFACEFCSIHAFYGFKVRYRPVAEVAAEIAALGKRYILFVDDNLFVDLPRAKALFTALIPLGIRWACQISIDIAQDRELLRLMAQSGCFAALIGFESLDETNLRQMKKGWNIKHQTYLQAIERFQELGIMIYGSFVFGYDQDNLETFAATAEFAVAAQFALVNFSALTPTPGSKLYERLQQEGRLLYDKWWLDPGYRYGDAAYQPANMHPDELRDGCREARRIFYSYGSIARRGLDRRCNSRSIANFAFYLGANLITRRELQSKLGRPLGE